MHAAPYVEALARLSPGRPCWRRRWRRRRARYGLGAGDNPVFPGAHAAAAAIAGGSLNAARALLEDTGEAWGGAGRRGRGVRHVFHPMGGLHHARPDRAAGFCLYNDPALAIAAAWPSRGAGAVRRPGRAPRRRRAGAASRTTRACSPSPSTSPGSTSSRARGTCSTWARRGARLRGQRPLRPGHGRRLLDRRPGGAPAPAGRALRARPRRQPARLRHPRPRSAGRPAPDHGRVRAPGPPAARPGPRHCGGRWLALGGGGYDVYRVVPRSWALLWAEMTRAPGPGGGAGRAGAAGGRPKSPLPLPVRLRDAPAAAPAPAAAGPPPSRTPAPWSGCGACCCRRRSAWLPSPRRRGPRLPASRPARRTRRARRCRGSCA